MNQDTVVITGGPSAGKTTLGRALRKKGYSVMSEIGSSVIRHGVFHPGKDRDAFQRLVFWQQLKVEKRRRRAGKLLFCDRGLLDGAAYYLMDNLPVPEEFSTVSVAHYKACFLLEPLDRFERNCIRPDFEDLEFTTRITPLLERCYRERGVRLVRLPAVSVDERLLLIEKVCENL